MSNSYPAGPSRNPNSVQRGSVQFLSKYPGDPATPGYPAYKNATRLSRTNVPSIPSLPISWNNAKKLLAEISPNATDAFALSGRLSKRTVRLNNQVNDAVSPIWNAMAVVPGHVRSEIVVVGCHRDAWVMGAADPTSGTAALVEVVKGFGELLRKGWRPLKTVVFASWDAEEVGPMTLSLRLWLTHVLDAFSKVSWARLNGPRILRTSSPITSSATSTPTLPRAAPASRWADRLPWPTCFAVRRKRFLTLPMSGVRCGMQRRTEGSSPVHPPLES